jgi:hypothetical protein
MQIFFQLFANAAFGGKFSGTSKLPKKSHYKKEGTVFRHGITTALFS